MATESTEQSDGWEERRTLRRIGYGVLVLSFAMILLGAWTFKAWYDDRNTRDCLLEVASATTKTRDAAAVWVGDLRKLINSSPSEVSPEEQEKARQDVLDSIDTYLHSLKEAGVSSECVEEVKNQAEELAANSS